MAEPMVQITWRRTGGKQWLHPYLMPRKEALELIEALQRLDKQTWGTINATTEKGQEGTRR